MDVLLAAVGVELPAALVRWWLEPWAPPGAGHLARDEALQAVVGGGGLVLVAYAAWAHAAGRATAAQARALAAAGLGFALTAFASAALRGAGAYGPAASLAGALVVLLASRRLLRDRVERLERLGRPRRGPAAGGAGARRGGPGPGPAD